MKLQLFIRYLYVYLIMVILICVPAFGCVVSLNMPPIIEGLEVQHTNLYPRQSTEIKCNVSDPEDDSMTFKWSSTDGSFSGTGSVVTWTAPNEYGDFHIAVVVEDDKGNSSQANVTINIVVNENPEPCEACDR